jgi:hypothetical protein
MSSPSTRLSFACAHTYLTALWVVFGFFIPAVQRAECQEPPHQKAKTVEIPIFPNPHKLVPTYGRSFQPGQGYDSIQDDQRNSAVFNSGLAEPEKGIARTVYSLQSAYSVAELASKLDVSVSAAFEGAGGGAKVGLNYAKQIASRRESIYVVVSVDVVNTSQGLILPYKPLVKDATSMSRDDFYSKYGDYFVTGIVYGGSYRGVLEIHNDSLAEKEDLRVHVEAHMGPSSGAADMQREISSITRNKTVTASVIREGGVDNIDPEQLLKEANEFPSKVTSGAAPVSVAVELQPYSSVCSKRIAPNTNAAYANLHYLEEQTKKLNDLQDILEFAMENPELFEHLDKESLKREMGSATEALDQINISAAKLTSDPTTATSRVTDYRAAFSEPELKNPPEFPVTIESFSWNLDSSTWAKTPSIAQGQAGTSGRWIQGFRLKFATRTYGLSIHYKGYFACGHLTNQNALPFDLSDGDLAGGPNTGVLCALRSLTIDLKGPRAGDYDVSYGGVIWQFIDPNAQARGGTAVTRAKKRGETLQVDSDQPEFNGVSPATWIQHIDVHVTKREPKKAEAE